MQEVAARGGKIVLVSDAPAPSAAGCALEAHIPVPTGAPVRQPAALRRAGAALAYHTAVFMGTDVDQPRNLAKSVTVE